MTGGDGESKDKRLFICQLIFSEVGEGDSDRDGSEDFGPGEFGVDFDAR